MRQQREVVAQNRPLPKKQPWRTTVFGHFRNTEMARDLRYKVVLRNDGAGPNELYDLRENPRRISSLGHALPGGCSFRESDMPTTKSGGSKRGFAAMDPAKQREIASKGGRASHGGGRRPSTSR
jgi:hypothetical protein